MFSIFSNLRERLSRSLSLSRDATMHSFSCSPRCGVNALTARTACVSAAPARVAARRSYYQLQALLVSAGQTGGIEIMRRQSVSARPVFRFASSAAPNAASDTVRLLNDVVIEMERI